MWKERCNLENLSGRFLIMSKFMIEDNNVNYDYFFYKL